jgi:hypothetical protein
MTVKSSGLLSAAFGRQNQKKRNVSAVCNRIRRRSFSFFVKIARSGIAQNQKGFTPAINVSSGLVIY